MKTKNIFKYSMLLAGLLLCIFEANAGNTYSFKGNCPSPSGGKMKDDSWGFFQCECVSFAAYKLNQIGVPFKNEYKKGIKFGSATNWSTAAQSAGLLQNQTPKVGAIAWFGSHVGYVEKLNTIVDKSGKTVVDTIQIDEYNYSKIHDYGTRTIKPNTVSKFIHFK